jgi:RNA polymerase sigma-70 factor (ECF subfamily)
MYRILHNLWVDQHRLRRREAPMDDPERDIGGEDGRRIVESRIELAQVRERIAALPDQQREVLVLVCIEDMSYREAAEMLGVPIGTVMSRLARARSALAEALADKQSQPAAQSRGAALP